MTLDIGHQDRLAMSYISVTGSCFSMMLSYDALA